MNNCNEITVINENGKEKVYGQIPDLWNLAMMIKTIAGMTMDGEEMEDGTEFEMCGDDACETLNSLIRGFRSGSADNILQTWHMAHDLKAAVEGQDQARFKQVHPEVEIIEVKRNIDLVMIRDTDGKIKFRSKRDFTRQQMLDHSAMRSAEGAPQL